MSRKVLFAVAFLTVALAVPAFAQSQYCYPSYPFNCQFIANGNFAGSGSGWTFTGGSAYATVTDQCAWGGGTSGAANLANSGSVYQEFNATGYSNYDLVFDAYFASTGSWYDQVTITVQNLDTSQQEVFYIRATDFAPSLCGNRVTFNLQNDYSDDDVRVTFYRATLSSVGIAIDNVQFWSR